MNQTIKKKRIKIRKIMKKIMMIAAMMVATVSAKAQFEPGTFSLQPKAGFVLSSVSGEDLRFKPGFQAGLEGQYQINNWFGLSAGLLYTTEGTKVKDVDWKLNLGYINIPIMAKFYVTKGLSLNAGLQPGIMVSAKEKYNEGGISWDKDVKDGCNGFDLSIPLSIAYEFTNGLTLEARYTTGLTNVGKDAGGRWDDNKNQVLSINIGYKFSL